MVELKSMPENLLQLWNILSLDKNTLPGKERIHIKQSYCVDCFKRFNDSFFMAINNEY